MLLTRRAAGLLAVGLAVAGGCDDESAASTQVTSTIAATETSTSSVACSVNTDDRGRQTPPRLALTWGSWVANGY